MDINRANMTALFQNIVKGFQDGMTQKPPVDLSFLVSVFTSSTAQNFYPWLEQIPGFRKWVGDRVFANVRSKGYTVPNRDFELSLTMPSKDLDDDQYGMYVGLTQMTAAGWPVLLYELLIEVLTNRGPVCFDDLALFANTHAYGENTIDNLVTDALTKTSFEAALLAAAAYKFSNDKPCRTQFTHLLYGPKLEGVVFDLLLNQYAYDGTDKVQIQNRNFKRVQPVQIPDFIGTYDDYWVLLDCSGVFKPVLRQVRKTPVVTMTTDPEKIAEQGRVNILADGRAAAAPTLPHLAYGGIL